MGSRLFWRRSATAAGMYASVVFGVLGTLIAARELGPREFGLLAIAMTAATFFQVLLDLTVEEAAIKYGFRYVEQEDWGRLRRLFGQAIRFKLLGATLAALVLAGLAPLGDSLFNGTDLLLPLLIVAVLPLAYLPEGIAGVALILRSRYDVRAAFLCLAMMLRLAAFAVGSQYGVTETVAAVVAAQLVSSGVLGAVGWLAFCRYPRAPATLLGEQRREIVRFVLQSSLGSGIVSIRGALTPLLLGVVATPSQVGFFRAAQAPQSGLAALTAPARLILLTEQTRDWERGNASQVLAGIRRYSSLAFLGMAVVAPPLFVWMPELIRFAYGDSYGGAAEAARFMLLVGALQLVFAWTKSLPISIGRPGLRIVTHSVETAVLIPLTLAFGAAWGATGAAIASFVGVAVFAALWLVIVERLHHRQLTVPRAQEAL